MVSVHESVPIRIFGVQKKSWRTGSLAGVLLRQKVHDERHFRFLQCSGSCSSLRSWPHPALAMIALVGWRNERIQSHMLGANAYIGGFSSTTRQIIPPTPRPSSQSAKATRKKMCPPPEAILLPDWPVLPGKLRRLPGHSVS